MLKILRLCADATRLRLVALLREDELSVQELQEILGMGQSRISSQLLQLKTGGMLDSRKSGKNTYYRLRVDLWRGELGQALEAALSAALKELPEVVDDEAGLAMLRRRRTDKARHYFNELAGKFGSHYCPGRSWKALAESLLKIMPPMVIADLGAGEGTFSQLLAQGAEKVIAVDNSENMVAFASETARKNGFTNLEFRLGDLQQPPIGDAEVDMVFLSQALHHATRPEKAVAECWRILKPGGRVVILDLLKHSFEQAREMYADHWLGFSEAQLYRWLAEAGFGSIDIAIVDKEEEPPHFQTLLAVGTKSV
jgi:ubiquinone/menaquinone biosynthesis C-methylase UbiE